MSLYDVARTLVNDYSRSQSGKLWQSYLLSAKLRDLRARHHMTQAEVAAKSGISESAVRNYEQQKSTPKQPHLEALASAFGIRPEALHLYDIGLLPANALFQLGETYGLRPRSDKKFAFLEPANGYMGDFMRIWSERYDELKGGSMGRDDYEQWKDEFALEFNPADFPLRYERAEGGFKAVEPWQNVCFAQTLRRLRDMQGITQEELASATGISKATIRSYEQRKRLPKKAQLDALAPILKVTRGALVFFDFGSPIQASHALFQIANQYGLIPERMEGAAVLRTIQPGLERCIEQWEHAIDGTYEGTDPYEAATYQEWKDRYDPDNRPDMDWKSRYFYHYGTSNRIDGAMESANDPFDERYAEQGGFLRA